MEVSEQAVGAMQAYLRLKRNILPSGIAREALQAAVPFLSQPSAARETDWQDLIDRPIVGIENRTPQEVHDILRDRIKIATLSSPDHADAGKVEGDGAVIARSPHINSGAFRRLSRQEWENLGGDDNHECDWHEGLGYVIYDDQARQEYLTKTNPLPSAPASEGAE